MIELDEQKAKDLNEILKFLLDRGKTHKDWFELSLYSGNIKPNFSKEYIEHLHSLIKYYNEKYNRNWLTIGIRTYVHINPNTEIFFEHGGYKKILNDELREERIKDLTQKQLNKNIFQMKYWWWILIFNAIISAIIVKLFS